MGVNPWEAPQLAMVNGEPVPVDSIKGNHVGDVYSVNVDSLEPSEGPPVETAKTDRSRMATEEVGMAPKVMEFDGSIVVKGRRLLWERTDGSVCLQYQDRLSKMGYEGGMMWLYARHVFDEKEVPLNLDGVDALGPEGGPKLRKFVEKLNKKHEAVELADGRIQIGDRILNRAGFDAKVNTVSGYLRFQSRFSKDPLGMTEQAIGYFDVTPNELSFWECQSLINFLLQQLVGVESEEETTDTEQD